jgi:hypothetical protein
MIALCEAESRSVTPAPEWTPPAHGNGDTSGLPGTDYNLRGSWRELLERYGWTYLFHHGGLDYWRRPGKTTPGCSATTGLRTDCGKDLLYNFSSNAVPFEQNQSYSKFAAKAFLEFGGNFKLCYQALLLAGYGTPATPMGQIHSATLSGGNEVSSARKIEPYVPFPTEALPTPLRQFVEHGSRSLGCDPAYFALPALAVVASCIGNARVIVLKPDWHEPSVLWSCVVGESSTLKSPAWQKVVAPLYRWQGSNFRNYEPLLKQWEKDHEKWSHLSKQHAAATAKAALNPNNPKIPRPPALADEPVKPVERRLIVSDTTVEKVVELLEQNPRGLLLVRDELGGWIGSFQRYRTKGSDLPFWLEVFRAGPYLYDRKTGDKRRIYVPRAAVSNCGSITPGALRSVLTAEHLDHGLGARLILAMPPRREKHWTEARIPADVASAYEDLLVKLLALDGDQDDQGELIPAEVGLNQDAKPVWIRFYNGWAKLTAAAEGDLASAYSKLEGMAARFTLLHHTVVELMAGRDGRADIGPESVKAGATLARWFGNEAHRIYSTLSETPAERDVRQLIEWLQQRGGSVTARDLQRSNARKYPSSKAANAALEELVKNGLGQWEQTSTTPHGGQPARRSSLRPTPDTTDSTHPEEPLPDEQASDSTSDSTSENPQKHGVFGGYCR